MKQFKYYFCEKCNEFLMGNMQQVLSCCGETLKPLEIKKEIPNHIIKITSSDNNYELTSTHPMTEEHYIVFIALIAENTLHLIHFQPNDECKVIFPKHQDAKILAFCNKHGIWETNI